MRIGKKNHVKGILRFPQDCCTLVSNCLRCFYYTGIFLSSKSFTQELDVTPTSRH